MEDGLPVAHYASVGWANVGAAAVKVERHGTQIGAFAGDQSVVVVAVLRAKGQVQGEGGAQVPLPRPKA